MNASESMPGWSDSDLHFMRQALDLAARGLNTTDPNPRVGCVLVRDGQVVGEGWHERAGGEHAEAHALRAAGAAARGATAYVTQEPCAAQGRTPPCTDALIAAGIRRVNYAASDPNPKMAAGGARLRDAGVLVRAGLLLTEARALNPGFYSRFERGWPWVRVKLGISLDGRTALASGASRWITGPEARADAQSFRARSSVVLTGIGTVLADDPALNVRRADASRQPLRVVLDRQLRAPGTARMFDREGPAAIFTACTDPLRRQQFAQRGVRIETVPSAGGPCGVDLPAVLTRLAALEANEIWVEAGPCLAGALLSARLVDELVVYMAPCLLGPQARPLAQLPELLQLDQRLRLEYASVERVGADLRIVLCPRVVEGLPSIEVTH